MGSEWAFIEEVSKRQNLTFLKEFVKHMWIYFNDELMSSHNCPLDNAADRSNSIAFVQLLIKTGIDLDMENQQG